jgi:hypothetical protein
MKQEEKFKIIQHDIRRLGIIILSNYDLKYQHKFGNESF